MSARCCRAVPRPDPVHGGRPLRRRSVRWSSAALIPVAIAALAAAPGPSAWLPAGAPDTGALHTGALHTGALHTGALHTGALHTGALHTGALSLAAATAVPAASAPAPAQSPSPALTWTAVKPATSPPPVTGASAAWDGDTSTVVLFGGVSSAGSMAGDTWTWDGLNWTDHPASQTNAPPARQQASMAFDPVLHRLILFGGQDAGGALLHDTWAWNGQQWTELSSGPQPDVGAAPSPRAGAAMALDSQGDLVLYGGTGYAPNQAPVATTTTTTVPPSSPGPTSGTVKPSSSGKSSSSSTGTTARRALADTWQWTSSGWVATSASGPPPLTGASLAYDSTSGGTLLFGGSTSAAPGGAGSAQTWLWNGHSWAGVKSPATPPGRYSAVLSDAPPLQGVVLLGGVSTGAALGDAWLWTPAGWSPAKVSGGWTPRFGAAWASGDPTTIGVTADPPATGSTTAGSTTAGANPPAGPPGGGGTTTGGNSTSDQAVSAATTTGVATLIFGGQGAGGVLDDTGALTAAGPAPTGHPSQPSPPTTAAALPTVPAAHSGDTHRSGTAPAAGRTTTTTAHPGRAPAPTTVPVVPPPSFSRLTIETDQRTVHRGTTVRVAGAGFRPGSPIVITFHSAPALVGRAIADPSGSFSAYVSVPDDATPGQHHFEASGTTSDGLPAALTAAVEVVGPPGPTGTSVTTKALLLGLALLIPAATWMAMATAGWWRRRSAGRPA